DDTVKQPNSEVEKKTIVQTQPSENVQNIDLTPDNQPEAIRQNNEPQTTVKTTDIRDIVVNEPKFVIVKPQQVVKETENVMAEQFSFDLQQQENTFSEQRNEFSFEIRPHGETANHAVSEQKEEIIRYDLNDYMEVEEQLLNSKQEAAEPIK